MSHMIWPISYDTVYFIGPMSHKNKNYRKKSTKNDARAKVRKGTDGPIFKTITKSKSIYFVSHFS